MPSDGDTNIFVNINFVTYIYMPSHKYVLREVTVFAIRLLAVNPTGRSARPRIPSPRPSGHKGAGWWSRGDHVVTGSPHYPLVPQSGTLREGLSPNTAPGPADHTHREQLYLRFNEDVYRNCHQVYRSRTFQEVRGRQFHCLKRFLFLKIALPPNIQNKKINEKIRNNIHNKEIKEVKIYQLFD